MRSQGLLDLGLGDAPFSEGRPDLERAVSPLHPLVGIDLGEAGVILQPGGAQALNLCLDVV